MLGEGISKKVTLGHALKEEGVWRQTLGRRSTSTEVGWHPGGSRAGVAGAGGRGARQ